MDGTRFGEGKRENEDEEGGGVRIAGPDSFKEGVPGKECVRGVGRAKVGLVLGPVRIHKCCRYWDRAGGLLPVFLAVSILPPERPAVHPW